ncbi:hypothetical protein GGI04_004297, partial [Coemansia thaxteri]
MKYFSLLIALLAFIALISAAPLAVEKRDDGPVLPLPGAGETAGSYLSRVIVKIP